MGRRLQALTVLAVAIAVYMAATAAVSPFIPDDAYISFRYAENLTAGNGLRFNTNDPRVEGYSNFLWIMVCAALHQSGLDLPTTAPHVGRIFGVLTVLVLWMLYLRRNVSPLGMLVSLLLVATSGPFVIYAASGLETALFAFLLVLLLWAYDRFAETKRVVEGAGLALVGFLVALCRPEGVLALPVIVGVMLLAPKRELDEKPTRTAVISAAALFGVLYVAYTAWRVTYFDAFLPTPFLSKSGGTVTAAWVTNFRHDFLRHRSDFPQIGYYVAAIIALAVAGARIRRDASRGIVEAAALCLGLVYAAVYINFVDWMPGMRYHAALIPALFVPIGHLWTLGEPTGASPNVRVANVRYGLIAVAALLASVSVFTQLKHTVKRIHEGNQLCLLPLADWIGAHTPPDWKLAMSDVGLVPYYSKRYTIDINPRSLTDPEAARRGWSEDYFYSKEPDIVVLVSRGVFVPKMYPEHTALMIMPRFVRSYRFIGAARQSWYEDRSYWVYFREDAPPLDSGARAEFPIGVGLLNRVER